jgi:hypothetical protein
MAHGAFGAPQEEAEATAEKAALYLSENGAAEAFAAIDDPAGPFRMAISMSSSTTPPAWSAPTAAIRP